MLHGQSSLWWFATGGSGWLRSNTVPTSRTRSFFGRLPCVNPAMNESSPLGLGLGSVLDLPL